MKVTLDTNVLLAAFISRGVCHDLFEHLAREHSIVTSEFILTEFRRVMVEKFRFEETKADAASHLIRDRATVVEDVELDESVSRDPNDDWILSVAHSSSSRCLITGDDDLLTLGTFRGIPILRPNKFWEFEMKDLGGR
jgi:putative PIN family toxin of toxin-antitoxin system